MTWQAALQGALHRNRSYEGVRYIQLATVSPDGMPAVRTVVFRNLDGDVLQFAVDSRSDKIEHIQHCPQAAVCWYFPKTREQFRFSGAAALITATSTVHQAERQALWEKISLKGRLLWYWPTPKAPRDHDIPFLDAAPADPEPPPEFILLRLNPHTVDHLQLRGEPQNRTLYTRDDKSWQALAVNP